MLSIFRMLKIFRLYPMDTIQDDHAVIIEELSSNPNRWTSLQNFFNRISVTELLLKRLDVMVRRPPRRYRLFLACKVIHFRFPLNSLITRLDLVLISLIEPVAKFRVQTGLPLSSPSYRVALRLISYYLYPRLTINKLTLKNGKLGWFGWFG